jgi:hypothetical protein
MASFVTAPEFTEGIPPLILPCAGADRRLGAAERRRLELVVQTNRLLFVLNLCSSRGRFLVSPLAASFSSSFSENIFSASPPATTSSSSSTTPLTATVHRLLHRRVKRVSFPGFGPFDGADLRVLPSAPPPSAVALDAEPASAASAASFSDEYHSPASSAISLVADELALPASLTAVPLLPTLPPDLQQRYSDLNSLLCQPPPSSQRRAHVFASYVEYCKVLRRLYSLNMIDFVVHSPAAVRAVNGLFAVPKEGAPVDSCRRLILDAQNANSFFVPPASPDLPTPSDLARLRLEARTAYMAKCDLSSFFYSFELPESWRPYFALPAVRAADVGLGHIFGDDTMIHPRFTRLPMGFSHAVLLTQAAHVHMLAQPSSPFYRRGRLLCPGRSYEVKLGDLVFTIYIDDTVLISYDPSLLNTVLDLLVEFYETICGWPVKRSKVLRATSRDAVFGLEFDGHCGTLAPEPSKLQRLVHATLAVVRRGSATSSQIEHLVGSWTWLVLVRRPLLSFFSAVYGFIRRAFSRSRPLWRSVASELFLLCVLSPLAVADLRLPVSSVVWCHDACLTGGAALSMTVPLSTLDALSSLLWHHPYDVRALSSDLFAQHLHRSRWRNVVARPFRLPEHINALEMRMALDALSHAIGSGTAECILFSFSDNLAVVCALAKGRSSSPSLARLVRRYAVLQLLFGIVASVQYVETSINPADGPSRAV